MPPSKKFYSAHKDNQSNMAQVSWKDAIGPFLHLNTYKIYQNTD